MYRKFLFASLILIVTTAVAFGAEKVAVFDFETIGVDDQTSEAATHIFRNELGATGKYTVISRSDMDSELAEKGIDNATCFAINCAADYGYALGVPKTIIGSLTRLGGRITTEVKLVSVVTKEVVFSDRFPANSVDDLDVALRKLAAAVAGQDKIESEVDRFAITEEETRDARRKKSYIPSGVTFGFGFPTGDSYGRVDNLKTIAWVVRYEAGKFVIDNSFGVTWGGGGDKVVQTGQTSLNLVDERSIAVLPWDIGLRYLFKRGADFTPFVGGGMGLHFVTASKANVSGTTSYNDYEYISSDAAFAIHLAGGVYAFQSYDFRLSIETKYTLLMTDAFLESGDTSHQIGISIGITRKFEKGEKRGCMSGGCLF